MGRTDSQLKRSIVLQPLAGQVVLITGGASGIGRATALLLARHGADVAVNDLQNDPTLADEIRLLGRRGMSFAGDVSDQSAVESFVTHLVAAMGRLDALVTCAYYSDEAPFHSADMAGFRRSIEVTMWGAFYALRAAANQMIRQGRGGSVVVVSSPHAREAVPNSMAYNMAKAALDQMARTAAVELLPHRIRVNIVHPGWTDTPGERKYFPEDVLRREAARLPWGRLAQPDEIARGILFLLDPASDYMTGSTLTIDGGLQLPWWSKRASGGF